MLALVTCHIFPPLNLIRKKMNSWHLTSRLTARSFSESTASRVRTGRCPRQCATLLHGQMYLQEKTPVLQFGHALEQNSSICPIISYLWMVDLVMRFFPVGPAFEDHPQEFGQKKVQPLGFYFWHLRLGLFKSPFFGWWSWTYVAVPFCKDKCIFSKNICFVIWARIDTKFLNSSHHVLSVGDWPGDATFFLWANLWRLSASIQSKKGPAPWILFLTPAPRPLQVTFLVGEDEHVCLYPFARTTVFSAKKMCFAIWARVDTKFLNSSHRVLSVGDWPSDATFFLWGQPLKIIRKYSVKKGPAPWILFLTPAPRPLQVTFFWLVKVNICVCTLLQSHVKNHTPSINHGTFFPGVWHLDMF